MSEFETSGGNNKKKAEPDYEGSAKVSDEVVAKVAIKVISEFKGIIPATPAFITGFRLGRKTFNSVRVNVSYNDEIPEIIVDAYVLVAYGIRIPDVCWDLQETLKKLIEKMTGYSIKAVNIYVHGIDFSVVNSKDAKEKFDSLDQTQK